MRIVLIIVILRTPGLTVNIIEVTTRLTAA